jgi:hypothetical protein
MQRPWSFPVAARRILRSLPLREEFVAPQGRRELLR